MVKITTRQQEILDYISKYSEENSYPPTLKEIASHFKVTIGTVQDHINALKKKGYISRKRDVARGFKLIKEENKNGLHVVNKSEPEVSNEDDKEYIPIYGSVAAGEPIFADDNIQGYISVQKTRRGHYINFALKVKGDSMKDAGIYNGDIVIVRKQDSADDGDVVIALLDDEATVKTLRKNNIRAYLEASNSKYKAIVNKPFKIIGKVIELRREYDSEIV